MLLRVTDLKTYFHTDDGIVPAVDGVSFTLDAGETLGIVGESGCGKSMTALSILRLVPQPAGRIVAGEIWLKDRNLLTLKESEMRAVRGNEISIIFQEPMTSLNPVFTVGDQIAEAIRLHHRVDKKRAWQKSIEALAAVGIPSPQERVHNYPHQMSGGMRQRVMIAMAIACQPSLLIADEPTTALDVTIQAQILDLIRKLQDEMGMGVLLITHDLGVIAETAHRVLVMYAGQIVESASVTELFENAYHPYSRGLLRAVPKLIGDVQRLATIEGSVPEATQMPTGCRFAPRCKFATDRCLEKMPELEQISSDRQVRCFEWKRVGEMN
ncbi:MAG: ABC transporter ATP-binding protein [Candidatus Poribacteria bacterium]|nr:ABC transporter ATP-binding protein [Candidatus Poribacteria bacterium]